MHLYFEKSINSKSDCSILSLTWMGKVPDELTEDDNWKLNRTNYYQEGWLAVSNVRGIIGVTFTASHYKKYVEYPLRTNFNLRGHRSEVNLVKWNEPYQKLASCDSSGIIFVWIKYEGRWSIELINDRSIPVTHFSWSHDGRMALICYQDGFVLVGSVAGQRYWSSMLNLNATITTGAWTPDDQQVYFGTTAGQIIVMDVHGAMVSQVQLVTDLEITAMTWSCEKFKMEEIEECDSVLMESNGASRSFVLAICFQNGGIYLLKSFDDVSPIQIQTGLQGSLCMEWSNSREILAIAGTINSPHSYSDVSTVKPIRNYIKMYSDKGALIYCISPPNNQHPISALTWGHNDKRLFISTGAQIHIARVSRKIASLQLLCRLTILNSIQCEPHLASLPLPNRIRSVIGNLFCPTIKCFVPERSSLRKFVSKPPNGSMRLHCTMIRHDEDINLASTASCYTLYLEYLGGLVPLLKGKRISKLKPEFVIFDPQVKESKEAEVESIHQSLLYTSKCHATRGPSPYEANCADGSEYYNFISSNQTELTYIDTLPEALELVEVTSNVWGTKFKIHGLVHSLPDNLGQITYKTSLLHLQPRQMTLVITELRDGNININNMNANEQSDAASSSFTRNTICAGEDEEDSKRNNGSRSSTAVHKPLNQFAPIAPFSPRKYLISKSSLISSSRVDGTQLHHDGTLRNTEHYLRADDDVDSNDRRNCDINAGQTVVNHGDLSATPGLTKEDSMLYNTYEACHSRMQVALPKSDANSNSTSDCNNKCASVSNRQHHHHHHQSHHWNIHQNEKITADDDDDDDDDGFNDNNDNNQKLRTRNRSYSTSMNSNNARINHTHYINNSSMFGENTMNTIGHHKDAQPLRRIHHLHNKHSTNTMIRSRSVGFLELSDTRHQLFPTINKGNIPLLLYGSRADPGKRLILVDSASQNAGPPSNHVGGGSIDNKRNTFVTYGKSRSFDYTDLIVSRTPHTASATECVTCINDMKAQDSVEVETLLTDKQNVKNTSNRSPPRKKFFEEWSPLIRRKMKRFHLTNDYNQMNVTNTSDDERNGSTSRLNKIITKMKESDYFNNSSRFSHHQPLRLPRSSPSSPLLRKKEKRPQSCSPIRKNVLLSPILKRMNRSSNNYSNECVFIDNNSAEVFSPTSYKDLETFQKAQLRQKLKRGRIEPNGTNCSSAQVVPQRREFVMHNKAPMWNENSQVYQLDFGGRVTQESAKNFQIEFRGKQVMQFGRIDGNAYTLDFQYPFSALQAFSVALANITQRLK